MRVIGNPVLRRTLRIGIPALLIPGTVALCALFSPEKRWAAGVTAVTVLSLIFFLSGYENRRVGTRRLVLCAIFSALSAVGRFLPYVKPVPALNILCGMYLSGEAGFFSGVLTALLSDLTFGMGPWTPFRMLAWGLTGLLGGSLSALLKKNRWFRDIFAALSGVLFSVIMDVWTVLWTQGDFSLAPYGAALLSALPFTLLYALSNVLFMELLFPFIHKKLSRIEIRYGL